MSFHLSPNFFGGGFIGVDVFFVISGFLITSIILSELQNKQFIFSNFYARRVRRIFPALLVVMGSVFLFGWLALLAPELAQLSKHTVAGLTFLSNLIFWSESGYFDNFVDRKLLLNLWSLGVEEQFYLVWPFFIYLGLRFKSSLFRMTYCIFLVSFIWCLYQTTTNSVAAFYSPFTRFWELLVGSFLALSLGNDKYAFIPSKIHLANALSALGFALLVAGIVFIDKQRSFPGWWALLPTVGAACLIASGKEAFLNKYVLSNSLAVGIGLISYPLYLWHWPILVYGNILNGFTPSYLARFGLIGLTFALSIATYLLIEKPIRTAKNKRVINITLILLSLALGIFALVTYCQDGFTYREKNYSKISRAIDAPSFPGDLKKIVINGKSYGFGFQQSDNQATTLFIGDSNIAHYYPRVNELLTQSPKDNYSVIFFVQHGCIPIPHVYSDIHKCNVLESLDIIKSNKNIKNIVIGSRWFGQLNGGYYYLRDGKRLPIERNSEGYKLALVDLKSFIATLKSQDKKVYLLLSSPIGGELDPRLLAKRSLKHFPSIIQVQESEIDLKVLMEKYGYIRDDLKRVANSVNVNFIDPIEFLCNAKFCPAISAGGDPIYGDPNHLNPYFTKSNASYIDQVLLAH